MQQTWKQLKPIVLWSKRSWIYINILILFQIDKWLWWLVKPSAEAAEAILQKKTVLRHMIC